VKPVSAEVISSFVRCWLAKENGFDRMGWSYVEDAFRFVYRWVALDASRAPAAKEIVKTLNLTRLPKKVIGDIVFHSDLIDSKRVVELYEVFACSKNRSKSYQLTSIGSEHL
jgi:hypothetical protein